MITMHLVLYYAQGPAEIASLKFYAPIKVSNRIGEWDTVNPDTRTIMCKIRIYSIK